MRKNYTCFLFIVFFFIFSSTYVQAQCWEEVYFDLDSTSLRDIHFLNSTLGVAGGENQKIIKSSVGGYSWNTINIPENNYWNTVLLLNENTIIVSEGPSSTFRTTDNGENWKEISPSSSQFPTMGFPASNIIFSSIQEGWICDKTGGLYYTKNGGDSWTEQLRYSNFDYLFCQLFQVNDSTLWIAGEKEQFSNNGALFFSIDKGENWILYNQTDIPTLASFVPKDIFFQNDTLGWICGKGNKILKTTDGGDNWLTIDLTNEATDFEAANIEFVDENRGWMLMLFENRILATNDGGLTWETESSEATSDGPLFTRWGQDLQMLNDTLGFWVDVKGRIYRYEGGKPDCESFMTAPSFANLNTPLLPMISWSATTGCLDGYRIRLGTTAGGEDILPSTDVGLTQSYVPTVPLPEDTTVYFTVVPYGRMAGEAEGCGSYFFYTKACGEAPVTYLDTMLCSNEILVFAQEDGCDSLVQIDVDFYPLGAVTQNTVLCPGDSLWIGDSLILTGGNYQFDFQTVDGCDSTYTLFVSELEDIMLTVDTMITLGTVFLGQTIMADTILSETYPAQNGCDSIVQYQISIITDTDFTTSVELQHYIFPNPSNGVEPILSIHSETSGMGSILIYNLFGQRLRQYTLSIPAGQMIYHPLAGSKAWSAGTYFYQLQIAEDKHAGRFVITK